MSDNDTPTPLRFCQKCGSERRTDPCWKCGAPTIITHPDWDTPKEFPVWKIREAAEHVGYAIGEHGSKERDIDLIAVPWTKHAVSPDELVDYICKHCNGVWVSSTWTDKPHGRRAVNIQFDGYFKHVDLSVTPRQETLK